MAEFISYDEEELAVGLFDRDVIKFGEFTLKSGRNSPIYYNQRPLLSIDQEQSMSTGAQRRLVKLSAEGYAARVEKSFAQHDHLYGIPQAATAIGALVAQETGSSYLWGRVGKKDYGKHEGVEGNIYEGETVVQLDDVVTNADSKIESDKNLSEDGLITRGFVVMLDREEGGRQTLKDAGHHMVSVLGLSDTVLYLRDNDRIGDKEIEALQSYHADLGAESSLHIN